MFEIIAVLAVLSALILLYVLSVIDLRDGLLPNEYVMGFAMAGAVFHLATAWHYLDLQEMALGGFIGAGFLYLIREIANRIYKQDTLGLGDVKLLGAAGIWLGPYYILFALTVGAFAGLIHGLVFALRLKGVTGTMPKMSSLSLPAGPGFAAGIVIAGIIQFHDLVQVLWP
ncbi:MAG: prepilin peptidase [Alphaproteobacteria bacterium PRO2]|nr:prepilin peptidase [Alphaproteobacteria bacterium PRO2]